MKNVLYVQSFEIKGKFRKMALGEKDAGENDHGAKRVHKGKGP
jgi:hypothetical protein